MRTKGVLVLLVAVVAASTLCGVADAYCNDPSQVINVNGDEFFNKCFIDSPARFGTVLAKNTAWYINPNQTTIVVFFMVCLLPFWYYGGGFFVPVSSLGGALQRKLKAQYRYMQINLINLLHRCNYSGCGTVMLYTIFRQRRPCACPEQVGSIYGMPSGDATHAGVIGALLMDCAPGHPIASRVFGLLVMILVAQERVSLGWHSIGQVTTGLTIGFASHFYSTRAPQFMVIVDSVVMAIVGLITVNVDSELQYQKWDDMNIRSWFTQGLGFLLFNCMCWARHMYVAYPTPAARRAAMWSSLYKQPHNPSADQPLLSSGLGNDALLPLGVVDGAGHASGAAADTPTGGESSVDDDANSSKPIADADWKWTLFAAFLCWWVTLIGYVVEQYATYA